MPMASPVESDGEMNLPRLSGPIPMPLPVSPLANYADTEALREEALQPTAAQSLLKRPDAVSLMAMPYLHQEAPSSDQTASPTEIATVGASGEPAALLPHTSVPAPGALAMPSIRKSEELAFGMQVTDADLGESASTAQPSAFPDEREPPRSVRPDAVLALLRERKEEDAQRQDTDSDRPQANTTRTGAVARQPHLSQALGRPIRRQSIESEASSDQELAEGGSPAMERIRTFLPREASADRAPMPLARTTATSARPKVTMVGDSQFDSGATMNGPGEIVHRQVFVQRAETGESAAGAGEAEGQQAQSGSHNAEQEHGKQGDEGAASGDVNLLANEVYGLIKRRLAQEAERMGRSR
jgi:hypothetical protein